MTDVSDPVVGAAVSVAARLDAVEGALADLAGELVPERIAGHDLARVVRTLGRIERRAGGARLVLTRAAADLGTWKAQGHRSPEEWAARTNGTTTAQAKADLRASSQLAALPTARAAVAAGELSTDAARAVAEGATADPTTEDDLLGTARTGDLSETRDKARRARQRADERDGKAAQRMHARRGLRTWLELDGEGRGTWNVPPAYQARFLAALEPYRSEAFRLARQSGRRETPEALMADALDLLARDTLTDLHIPDPTTPTDHGEDRDGGEGDPGDESPDRDVADGGQADAPGAPETEPGEASGDDTRVAGHDHRTPTPDADHRYREKPRGAGNRRAPAQLVVHASYEALVRGFATDGEVCEVPGLGPVPVTFARFLATDCLLRVVLTGTDVTVISSDRRYVPAALRAALDARDTECVVPGCHATHHLERDHWGTDFAKGGPTALANLCRLCRYHHFLKTHCGWTLTGGPGHWRFEPPP